MTYIPAYGYHFMEDSTSLQTTFNLLPTFIYLFAKYRVHEPR